MNHLLLDPRFFATVPLSFHFPDVPPDPSHALLLAFGKSAFLMIDRFLQEHPCYRVAPIFLVVPEGLYPISSLPHHAEVVFSTHPHLSEKSFIAGNRLTAFLDRHSAVDTVVTLLSGGASALIEVAPDKDALIAAYRRLLYSGFPIQEINRRRIALSQIKGGKLTRRLPHARWITFVMSDIPQPDGHYLVGSMPTYDAGNPRQVLIPVADGSTLHEFCAEKIRAAGYRIVAEERFLTGTVEAWAGRVTAQSLGLQDALLFTGEPTVKVTASSPGIGGRMAHLALLLVEKLGEGLTLYALSSDGREGNSPYAGVVFTPTERRRFDMTAVADYRDRFDAYSFFERYGCAVATGYTGVNLNDVVVVLRDDEVPRSL